MSKPTYTPRQGVGTKYKDGQGRQYVFTSSGWRLMANDVAQQAEQNNTFEVKPDEKEYESILLKNGVNQQDAYRAIAERRRIKQNLDQSAKLEPKTNPTDTNYFERNTSNPFGAMSKQEVLLDAYNHGVTKKSQLDEIGELFDTFGGYGNNNMQAAGELLKQRKELVDAGFDVSVIDNKLEEIGFARASGAESDTTTGPGAEFAADVSRTLNHLEEISGLDSEETIFKGGSTTLGKLTSGLNVTRKKAVNSEYSQKVDQYNDALALALGTINQMRGAGVLNEGEAQQLIATMPNEYSSEDNARAWFKNARAILGVDLNSINSSVDDTGNENKDSGLLGTIKSQFAEEKGIGERIDEKFIERGASASRQVNRVKEGELNPISGGLRVIGQGAGFIQDLGGIALDLITPKFLEDAAADIGGQIAESEVAKRAADEYTKLKAKHPEAMQDLEAVINIASLPLMGKGGKFAISKTADIAGDTISYAGKTVKKLPLINRAVKSVDEVIEVADDVLKNTSEAVDAATTTAGKRAAAASNAAKPTIRERWAGISPDIKTRIAGKHDQLKEYFDIAHTRNSLDTAPTPLEFAAERVNKAVSAMEGIINDTGSKIGAFREKVSSVKVPKNKMRDVETVFMEQLEKVNLKVVKGKITKVPNTVTKIGSNNDITVLQSLYDDFLVAKKNRDLGRLYDLRSAFDNQINFNKTAREVSKSVDPISRSVRSKIANIGAEMIGPDEAKRLTDYSNFLDAYDLLTNYTNKKTGSEFLLKQVLSERSRAPRAVLDAVREYTGIDLMDDAVMSSIATDLIGNSRQKGLFRQEITKAGLDAAAVLRGDPRGAIDLTFNFLKNKLVDEEKLFLKAAK